MLMNVTLLILYVIVIVASYKGIIFALKRTDLL